MGFAAPTEAPRLGGLAQQLVDLVERQTASVRQMALLADQTRQAVARRAIDALSAAVAASETALAEHDRLERQWRATVEALAGQLGEQPERLTLARLAEEVPEPQRQALLRAGRALRLETERLAAKTRQNQHLLEASRRLVDDCLGFLHALRARGAGYTAEGRSSQGGSMSRLLDQWA